jgi:hypothetical protein
MAGMVIQRFQGCHYYCKNDSPLLPVSVVWQKATGRGVSNGHPFYMALIIKINVIVYSLVKHNLILHIVLCANGGLYD